MRASRSICAGITLMEVVVVMSILVLLMALLMPVFGGVKQTGNIAASLGKLSNIHRATLIYQADYAGDGQSYEGLPTQSVVFSTFLGLGKEAFKSPCGYKGIIENKNNLGYQYAWEDRPDVLKYFVLREGSAILFTDASCNASRAVWESPPAVKRALGVRLDGSLVNMRKAGLPISLYWWDK